MIDDLDTGFQCPCGIIMCPGFPYCVVYGPDDELLPVKTEDDYE